MSRLLLLLVVDRLAGKEKRPMGLLFGTFGVSYFALRFLVEYFKAYQTLPTSYPVTMGQLLSIPFILAGVGVIIWSLKARRPGHIPPVVADAPAAGTPDKQQKKK